MSLVKVKGYKRKGSTVKAHTKRRGTKIKGYKRGAGSVPSHNRNERDFKRKMRVS